MIIELLQKPVTQDLNQYAEFISKMSSTATEACAKSGCHDTTLAAAAFLKLAGIKLPEGLEKTKDTGVAADGRKDGQAKNTREFPKNWTPEEMAEMLGKYEKPLTRVKINADSRILSLNGEIRQIDNNTWELTLSQPEKLQNIMRLIQENSANAESYRVDIFNEDLTACWTAFGGRNKPASILGSEVLERHAVKLKKQIHQAIIYWVVVIE